MNQSGVPEHCQRYRTDEAHEQFQHHRLLLEIFALP